MKFTTRTDKIFEIARNFAIESNSTYRTHIIWNCNRRNKQIKSIFISPQSRWISIKKRNNEYN